MLFTGMRATEFTDFINVSRGAWYSRARRIIDIPASSVRKAKIVVRRRSVILSNAGVRAMEDIIDQIANEKKYDPFFMPTRQSWNDTLLYTAKKAGMKAPELFIPKLTRKTWESWLVTSYPLATASIMVSMGHSTTVSIQHYLGLGFSKEEKEQIKRYTEGWLIE
jgi:integrase